MTNKYDRANIETMELLYGRGYLSMGGDAEVARIVESVTVAGCDVLDVGCGMAGAAITLARDHDAKTVTGVDIDAGLLSRGAELVAESGLGERVALSHVDPGPLPFAGASFDLVYLTAVSCHIEQLGPFLSDIRRLIRPGGKLVGGEWFIQQENDAYRRWDEMLRRRGLSFYFVTRAQFVAELEAAGFIQVSFTDRSACSAGLAAGYLERSQNQLRGPLIERMGEDGFRAHLDWTRIRAEGLALGGSGYGHFVAANPAA